MGRVIMLKYYLLNSLFLLTIILFNGCNSNSLRTEESSDIYSVIMSSNMIDKETQNFLADYMNIKFYNNGKMAVLWRDKKENNRTTTIYLYLEKHNNKWELMSVKQKSLSKGSISITR